jgi:preprotein translocase subunit SecG
MWFAIKLLLWVLFLGSAVLLSIVVLLQESKGGGLAEAFGGAGAETFGVKTRGISKFTFTLAGVFVASAILLHMLWNA